MSKIFSTYEINDFDHLSRIQGLCHRTGEARRRPRLLRRLFDENEFGAAGRETRFVQINNSLTANKGTLRGLHYQLPPAAEVKVVRAIKGVLWDVIVDLRAGSPTYLKMVRRGAEREQPPDDVCSARLRARVRHPFRSCRGALPRQRLLLPGGMSADLCVGERLRLHGPRITRDADCRFPYTNPILRFGNDCVQILWL